MKSSCDYFCNQWTRKIVNIRKVGTSGTRNNLYNYVTTVAQVYKILVYFACLQNLYLSAENSFLSPKDSTSCYSFNILEVLLQTWPQNVISIQFKTILYFTLSDNIWRGAWIKALSDFWLSARFSLQITLYSFTKHKDNYTLHQKSLEALFQDVF